MSDLESHLRMFKRVVIVLGMLYILGRVLLGDSVTSEISQVSLPRQCIALSRTPEIEVDHTSRQNDRYDGSSPTLIRNARWNGGKNGTEVIRGDILMDQGLFARVGKVSRATSLHGLRVVDVQGAWVSPGIVDMHSHLGDSSSPELKGSTDDNSLKGNTQPWLRSLDGLNTHDDSYALSISGGVTSALVLPGSANAIGGQGFTIKLRPTAERSTSSMLLEPPHNINTSFPDHSTLPFRWRQMKHACGENPSSVYKITRMDTIWNFREAYNEARKVKVEQDGYCSRAASIVSTPEPRWWEERLDKAKALTELGKFPEDLKWEALVDVLRGRVKVQTHCYEAVDLDALVRLSNEFEFSIAAFHHASETYLVPDLLKKMYGKPPAVALFATNGRYKREAWRASEFAPRILASHGFDVAMKSDHPVLNSRYLLYEAQQAHFYGLSAGLALASVTSTPAKVLGLDHRIGHIKQGWDADLVVWDSHPLALGATPSQVFIDGIPQLKNPFVNRKPETFQTVPKVPNFDKETEEAVEYEGLPPLEPEQAKTDFVVFTNVRSMFTRTASGIQRTLNVASGNHLGVVLVKQGVVTCSGLYAECLTSFVMHQATVIDLKGGSLQPSLTSYGAPLGLQHIDQEPSTNDGRVLDPLVETVPSILGGDTAVIRAVDGLQYGARDSFLAYRSGCTKAITAPSHKKFYAGLGTFFSLGAAHKLETGAVIQDVTALHVTVRHFGNKPSISTQIAALRRLLLTPLKGESGEWFNNVAQGRTTLVVETESADIIATLVMLKREVENKMGSTMKLTITGANEAHILAKELGEAGVGVVLTPARPFPAVWESRRILAGPPLTEETAVSKLLAHNVTVGLGVDEIWSARNTRFDVAWASLEAGRKISQEDALSLGSTNLESLLGVHVEAADADMVATEGGTLLEMQSKVVAVISPLRRLVDIL